MIRTLKRSALVLFCLLVLSGCTIRIAYAMLDTLMSWQLGQYVSLHGEQKKLSKKRFKEFHDWHRNTQLTLYAQYLEELKRGMLAGNITGRYLHSESDKLQVLLDQSIEYLVPGLTDVAISLSDEQIQEIVAKLGKEREEYKTDYLDADDKKVQKRRIRDITRYIGGFFGTFSDEQKQLLRQWEENLIPHEALMIHQQNLWQQEFLEAMANRSNRLALEKKVHSLMLVSTDNWDPELQSVLDINQAQTFEMLANLFNSQSPKQKKQNGEKV